MAKIDENAPAAAVFQSDEKRVSVKQVDFVVPGLSVKDLLSAIPAHCTRRSAIRSGAYIVWDCALIYGIYGIADALEAFIAPSAGNIVYPHPLLHTIAWTVLWAWYTFASGLVMTGLWVIAHECGHQAFSESKFINNTVGWILHSALGVPYHSWRITHAKHHASTGHLYQDQVFVPKTRSDLKLPAFDPAQEDIHGSSVTEKVKAELWDALGDSPIGAVIGSATYLLGGWPSYIMFNASGQRSYPKGTNHFKPTATMFKPTEYWSVVISDLGILLWLAALGYWSYTRSFGEMMRLYGVGYLWVNHWLVAITFLQHTDPLLPHYRPPTFTFARGALTTFDREMLGGAGRIFAWIGARATHGIAETHVLHHVSSKIPHYHAWEASAALRARLDAAGVPRLEGRPVGWSEIYRVYKECKFVEDDGQVVFYKNANGLAAARPVWPDGAVSDSGVDLQ